jgi:hypothetical protein
MPYGIIIAADWPEVTTARVDPDERRPGPGRERWAISACAHRDWSATAPRSSGRSEAPALTVMLCRKNAGRSGEPALGSPSSGRRTVSPNARGLEREPLGATSEATGFGTLDDRSQRALCHRIDRPQSRFYAAVAWLESTIGSGDTPRALFRHRHRSRASASRTNGRKILGRQDGSSPESPPDGREERRPEIASCLEHARGRRSWRRRSLAVRDSRRARAPRDLSFVDVRRS